MPVRIKRIYEPISNHDGYRVLVDRLWPRGIKKENAQIDEWLKDVAPSQALRQWFGHQPEKWASFYTRYSAELYGSVPLEKLKTLMIKHETLTLLYAAKNEEYNHAIIIKELLQSLQ